MPLSFDKANKLEGDVAVPEDRALNVCSRDQAHGYTPAERRRARHVRRSAHRDPGSRAGDRTPLCPGDALGAAGRERGRGGHPCGAQSADHEGLCPMSARSSFQLLRFTPGTSASVTARWVQDLKEEVFRVALMFQRGGTNIKIAVLRRLRLFYRTPASAVLISILCFGCQRTESGGGPLLARTLSKAATLRTTRALIRLWMETQTAITPAAPFRSQVWIGTRGGRSIWAVRQRSARSMFGTAPTVVPNGSPTIGFLFLTHHLLRRSP